MKCPKCDVEMEKDVGTYLGRRTYGYFCWICGEWYWEDVLMSNQETEKGENNEIKTLSENRA